MDDRWTRGLNTIQFAGERRLHSLKSLNLKCQELAGCAKRLVRRRGSDPSLHTRDAPSISAPSLSRDEPPLGGTSREQGARSVLRSVGVAASMALPPQQRPRAPLPHGSEVLCSAKQQVPSRATAMMKPSSSSALPTLS